MQVVYQSAVQDGLRQMAWQLAHGLDVEHRLRALLGSLAEHAER